MRTSLAHIPLAKQQELQTIVQHICQQHAIDMIILFAVMPEAIG